MRQKKPKKKWAWQQCIAFVVSLLIGAVSGVVMVSCLEKSTTDTPLLTLGILLFGMYVGLFLHVIIHEAGHLVFGLLTGYTFSSFRIASFLWQKENGRIRIKRIRIAGTGGQCLMSPPDMKDGKIPYVLYNLGGSLINAFAGVLFLIGYLLFSDMLFLSPFFLMLAVTGFITAILNGVPMRMGAVDNDGYNAFSLLKNREAAEAFWVQLKVAEQNAKGVRLKDMPAEWFAVPTEEAMKNSMVAARGVLACNRLIDEKRFEEADALMAHLLTMESGIVALYRSLLLCDRIYVALIGEKRREVIEGMMSKAQKRFMKAMKSFPSVIRTEYALALLFEKDTQKAEAIKNTFEKVAKTYPYSQDIESERELMRIAESNLVAQG